MKLNTRKTSYIGIPPLEELPEEVAAEGEWEEGDLQYYIENPDYVQKFYDRAKEHRDVQIESFGETSMVDPKDILRIYELEYKAYLAQQYNDVENIKIMESELADLLHEVITSLISFFGPAYDVDGPRLRDRSVNVNTPSAAAKVAAEAALNSGDVSQLLIAFHKILQLVHDSGYMAEYFIGPGAPYWLTYLSENKELPEQWERQYLYSSKLNIRKVGQDDIASKLNMRRKANPELADVVTDIQTIVSGDENTAEEDIGITHEEIDAAQEYYKDPENLANRPGEKIIYNMFQAIVPMVWLNDVVSHEDSDTITAIINSARADVANFGEDAKWKRVFEKLEENLFSDLWNKSKFVDTFYDLAQDVFGVSSIGYSGGHAADAEGSPLNEENITNVYELEYKRHLASQVTDPKVHEYYDAQLRAELPEIVDALKGAVQSHDTYFTEGVNQALEADSQSLDTDALIKNFHILLNTVHMSAPVAATQLDMVRPVEFLSYLSNNKELPEKWEKEFWYSKKASKLNMRKKAAKKDQQKFIDQLKNSKDPATATKGYGYFIIWADGRAQVAYKHKQDAIDFIDQDNDDPYGMDVYSVKYREAEKGERVRNKFTEASAKTYRAMKKAWDNPPRDDATYPGSNVSGPVPHSTPKSPGSMPRKDQGKELGDSTYFTPSTLDREPEEKHQKTSPTGQGDSGQNAPDDDPWGPSNKLRKRRPNQYRPFDRPEFNEDYSEYTQRQFGLNMMRRIKKGTTVYHVVLEFESNMQEYYAREGENMRTTTEQSGQELPFPENAGEMHWKDFPVEDFPMDTGIPTTDEVIDALDKNVAAFPARMAPAAQYNTFRMNYEVTENSAKETFEDISRTLSSMGITNYDIRVFNYEGPEKWRDVTDEIMIDDAMTLPGNMPGGIASKLNMQKKSNDDVDRIVAQWQQTADAAGADVVLEIFNDRTRAYNITMSDLRGKYPEGTAHAIAIEVIDAVLQALQVQSSKLNMKKTAEVNPKYDHGTVQTSDVPDTVTDAIKDIQADIDEDKLYDNEDEPGWVENGIQKLFHITVLFGTNDDVKDKVQKVFEKHRPVTISATGVEYFSSNPDFDVAIVKCESEELVKIHDELKDSLENEDSYPEYNPHITIAYLKKGERLDDSAQISSISWEMNSLDISTSDGQLIKVSALEYSVTRKILDKLNMRKAEIIEKDWEEQYAAVGVPDDPSVHSAEYDLANDPDVPKEILAEFAQAASTSRLDRYYVARHHNTPPEILVELFELFADDDTPIGHRVAENPNTPTEFLAILAENGDWEVRQGVAINPNTSPEILTILSTDKDWRVRHAVSNNPNTPSEIREKLQEKSQTDADSDADSDANRVAPGDLPEVITFLDLGGPTLHISDYKNSVFQGMDSFADQKKPAGGYQFPEGYVSFNVPEDSSIEDGYVDEMSMQFAPGWPHISGDLNKGLPQIEDNSVQGTIWLGNSLAYLNSEDTYATLARDIARVSAIGTEVGVQDNTLVVDNRKQPKLDDDLFFSTLIENGFQLVSFTLLDDRPSILFKGNPDDPLSKLWYDNPISVTIFRKVSENVKKAKRFSSILDEPRSTLDSAIWDIGRENLPMLKPNVKMHIIENFFAYIAKFGGYISPEQWVKNMFYTGSTATYTYNVASDVDIHIIVDWNDLMALNPDKIRPNLKEMWQELHDVFWWTLNKIKLPGTKHPLTYYVMPPGEEKKLVDQKEEIYDMGHDVWLIPPGKARDLTEDVIDPALKEAGEFMDRINQHIADARRGVIDYVLLQEVITRDNAADRYMQIAEKLRTIDNELKALKEEYALLKQKRTDAFEQGDSLVGGNSNYSLGNIIFKVVERYKYMDILRKIKQITDGMDLRPDQVDEIAKALGLDLEIE